MNKIRAIPKVIKKVVSKQLRRKPRLDRSIEVIRAIASIVLVSYSK